MVETDKRQISISDLMEASGVRFGTSGARGLVKDMTGEVCFAYTSAFLQAIAATSGRVALAIDLRPSSPRIAAACAAAIQDAGLEVDYCGAIPTPALAYYAQFKGIPAIMVTGSHIPFDRNGIKFYGTSGEITKADENNISRAVVALPASDLEVALPEVNPDARRCYVDRYLRFFPEKCLAGMKLGFYEHSSVARDVLREILETLGAKVTSLGRTDEFVPIDTEAVNEDDVQRARDWAEQYRFDAIISTDGDADRPLVGDEQGQWLRGDVAGIQCAQYLGAQAVATTVSCNTAVELCGTFGEVVRTRIGSPYVIEAMQARGRVGGRKVVGFEPNGGFLVGSPIEKNGRTLEPLMTRDAALPILCLLSMAREKGSALSSLALSLPPRFTASDRLQNFPTETSGALLLALAASPAAVDELFGGLCGKLLLRPDDVESCRNTGGGRYPVSERNRRLDPGLRRGDEFIHLQASSIVRMDQTDGLRMTFAGSDIVHFRPSGNAPELRCYAESDTPERARELVLESLKRFKLLAERTKA